MMIQFYEIIDGYEFNLILNRGVFFDGCDLQLVDLWFLFIYVG